MIIDRLGGIDPLKNVQNTQKAAQKSAYVQGRDSITVSAEAQEMAEAYYASEVAAQTPDVRMDKIAEIKEKIKDPNYITSAMVDVAAERFMDSLGI